MNVFAVGASAGGVEALTDVVASLPADLPACVLVTVHIGPHARSKLPEILSRAGPLPAGHPDHGEMLRPGRIYVAPPGYHLVAAAGMAYLSAGPMVNRHRPAVDVMFAAAAQWAGQSTVAAVLSGLLDDGAVGSAMVARAGGRVLVQDPAEAIFDSMPRAAWAAVPAALSLPAGEMGVFAEKILAEAGNDRSMNGGERTMHEASMAGSSDPLYLAGEETGLTRLTCPDCSGALAEARLPGITFYRCHVGHQYGPKTLEDAKRSVAEKRLWAAVAALDEHAAMGGDLAEGQGADEDYGVRARRSAELAGALRAQLNLPEAPVGFDPSMDRMRHDGPKDPLGHESA